MNEESNLKLWKSVETTDEAHTKKATVSGQVRTTIKAIFQKEKATKVFGIQGISWGVVVGSESYDRIIADGDTLLQYLGTMFFVYEGVRGEVPIASAIKEVSTVKRGKPGEYVKVDEEAIKKVRTSAMTKGLSELGFNADVFKGMYDIAGYSEYATSVTAEEELEHNEAKDIADAEEYAAWKLSEIAVYQNLSTIRAVTTAHAGHVRKALKIGDNAGVKIFTEHKDNRIEELKCLASTN